MSIKLCNMKYNNDRAIDLTISYFLLMDNLGSKISITNFVPDSIVDQRKYKR